MRTAGDSRRRGQLLPVASLVAALVLVRCFLPTFYESYFFDSDQAIVGLMARHLRAGREFPLYYYGLNYLLGVQAWIIAPFFVVLRPTVAAMRAPLVLLNVAVAIGLVGIFVRRLGMRPWIACAAALPFAIPTPATASELVEAAGASIEPFVYVLTLWMLRKRPLPFGLLLGFAVLHREFAILTVPALVASEAATGELWDRANVRRAAMAAVGCALVWLVVDDVKLHLAGGSVALQALSLRGQTCMDIPFGPRVAALVGQALPLVYGGRPTPLQALRIDSPAAPGHWWIWWLVVATLAFMIVRIAQHWRRREPRADAGLGLYLAVTGALTVCVYPLSCNVVYGAPPVLRYLLFALLLPIGVFAAFAICEPSRRARSIVAGVFALWAMVNLADHATLIAATIRTPPLGEHRVLTDALLERGIRYASATYWDAYVVDFLSRERVIVASNDTVRMPTYQQEVAAHGADAVNLARQPCQGFATIASWCLQK